MLSGETLLVLLSLFIVFAVILRRLGQIEGNIVRMKADIEGEFARVKVDIEGIKDKSATTSCPRGG
jgi:hypothetical protein